MDLFGNIVEEDCSKEFIKKFIKGVKPFERYDRLNDRNVRGSFINVVKELYITCVTENGMPERNFVIAVDELMLSNEKLSLNNIQKTQIFSE